MKRILKVVALVVLLSCAGVIATKVYDAIYAQSTKENLKLIKEHINNAGRLVDYNGQIGVRGIEDIRLYVKKDKVKIKFGKITLTWGNNEFRNKEYKELLEAIGITWKYDVDTDRLRVFYHGEELERWAS